MQDLSHHECHVLALIRRWQPTTAYFIRKTLEQGLASTFSSSPGSVYPVIARLKKRGLVSAAAVSSDGRRTDHLECTAAGDEAVAAWVRRVDLSDVLPEDVWRTRMAFADALSEEERLAWLLEMRSVAEALRAGLAAQEQFGSDGPAGWALENARMLNDARIAWIERVIAMSVTLRAKQ